jgi:hypothetical protein
VCIRSLMIISKACSWYFPTSSMKPTRPYQSATTTWKPQKSINFYKPLAFHSSIIIFQN